MQGSLGDKARLNHILVAIDEIENYLIDTDYEGFLNNSMMRFACIKQLEIIGEASSHISEETKTKFLEIEWNQLKGMRNVFVHEYFGIDSTLMWQIMHFDIPELKKKVKALIQSIS
jgi:uncharacterized protein with HEPN domain